MCISICVLHLLFFFLFFLNVKRSAFVFASTLLMFIFWWLLLLDPKRIWFLNGVLNASFLCSFHFEAYRMVVIFCYKEHVWFWIRTGFIIFYKFFILFPWFRFLFSLVFFKSKLLHLIIYWIRVCYLSAYLHHTHKPNHLCVFNLESSNNYTWDLNQHAVLEMLIDNNGLVIRINSV